RVRLQPCCSCHQSLLFFSLRRRPTQRSTLFPYTTLFRSTGSDDVFDAALRRCGVLRVQSISDLFYMAEVLSKQPRPRGPRLTMVTNAGGPGVLATDALIPNGGELTPLSQESLSALNGFLPPHWSHANPIDILGDADPELYEKAVKI